jgi:hypothetical protein
MPVEKRKLARRTFSYYMRVMNEVNGQLVGHLSDISTGGFKLDSKNAIPTNKDFRLRIELNNEVADKAFMVFSARSKWCSADPLDPTAYSVGFQITNMNSLDFDIFARMFEKFGTQSVGSKKSSDDYMWR